ncbi:unnamed protein product [Paramecium sonneborni]|uniref:Uncharacterized protein n=1 Tax=Paramecium sonneborni TaxID=65129 RepID=A0A8S1L1R3_9CILI|nr:unnamed protein product [Paramecium sonneborni]
MAMIIQPIVYDCGKQLYLNLMNREPQFITISQRYYQKELQLMVQIRRKLTFWGVTNDQEVKLMLESK